MSRTLIPCGHWEVDDEVGTYCLIFKPLGVTTLCLYCYAMLVDVDWFVRFMKDVRVIYI